MVSVCGALSHPVMICSRPCMFQASAVSTTESNRNRSRLLSDVYLAPEGMGRLTI